jgi:hypothetical protein
MSPESGGGSLFSDILLLRFPGEGRVILHPGWQKGMKLCGWKAGLASPVTRVPNLPNPSLLSGNSRKLRPQTLPLSPLPFPLKEMGTRHSEGQAKSQAKVAGLNQMPWVVFSYYGS